MVTKLEIVFSMIEFMNELHDLNDPTINNIIVKYINKLNELGASIKLINNQYFLTYFNENKIKNIPKL